MAEKDAESWTLSFLMAEKFGKQSLQYIMVRINSENRPLSLFMLDKAWKVGLLIYFYVGKSSESFRSEKTFFCGKVDLVIS